MVVTEDVAHKVGVGVPELDSVGEVEKEGEGEDTPEAVKLTDTVTERVEQGVGEYVCVEDTESVALPEKVPEGQADEEGVVDPLTLTDRVPVPEGQPVWVEEGEGV